MIHGMKCPKCDRENFRIVDTKTSKLGDVTLRQYICKNCGYNARYATFPTLPDLKVIKSGRKYPKRKAVEQDFSWRKLLNSIAYAMERPPRHRDVAKCALAVLARIQAEIPKLTEPGQPPKIPSRTIGEFVLDELLKDKDYDSAMRYFSYFRRPNKKRGTRKGAIKDLDDMKQRIQGSQMTEQREINGDSRV